MKMNLKNLFIGMAMCSLFVTVSCQDEKLNTDNEGSLIEKTTIKAIMETPTETRTQLGTPSDGITPITWSTADVIKVFTATGSADFTLSEGAGSSSAEFVGELDGDKTCAIYPSTATTATSHAAGAEMSITLPVYQSYVADNIGIGSYPTIAEVDGDGNLAFKNLCGILKLQLTGTAKVTQIVIKSSAVLSGNGSVAISATPVLTMNERGNNYVVLNCQTAETGMGVQLNATTPTKFYIVVPPTAIESFTFEIASIDGILQKTTQANAKNIFVRSQILGMPPLAYATDITFGGTATKYSPAFIGGNWWSPVNAGYKGDDVTGVLYSKAELETACPEGWILPKATDLQALFGGGIKNNVVGYYGNGGGKGTWFGQNASTATIEEPLNCIWSPYTGSSDDADATTFIYRSMDAASYLVGNLISNETSVTMSNLDGDASQPVRCVVITENTGTFPELKKNPVASATASAIDGDTGQPGETIEFSHDNDMTTGYHSKWNTNGLPYTLTYTLEDENGIDLDYIHYHYAGGGNGKFGNVEIYLSNTTNDDDGFGTKVMTYPFGEKGSQKVVFPETKQNIKHVKFIVLSGFGNFASCREMEFWSGRIATPVGKHTVESATASSTQPGAEITRTIDGNIGTGYHSEWITGDTDPTITTRMPVDLTYTLEGNGVDLDYIYYYTGHSNGSFGKVDIYFSTTTNDAVGYGDTFITHDFGKDGISEKAMFPKTQKDVKHVKFVVRTARGEADVSCLEMEFWKNE